MKSTRDVYRLRTAIADGDKETIAEILGVTAEDKVEMLWRAIRILIADTPLVRGRMHDDTQKGAKWKPKWQHTPTRTIRVPVIFAEDILKFAHELDLGCDVYQELEGVIKCVREKKKGYTANSASNLIADIVAILESE